MKKLIEIYVDITGCLRRKKVFCSDMTFSATLNPVVYERGIPIFIETEESFWDVNPVFDVKLVVCRPI